MSKFKTKDELIDYLENHPMVAKSKVISDYMWVVQKHSNGSFISLIQLVEKDGWWLHIARSEGSNPPLSNCPKEFLKDVKVVNQSWRNKVNGSTITNRRRRFL